MMISNLLTFVFAAPNFVGEADPVVSTAAGHEKVGVMGEAHQAFAFAPRPIGD